MGAAADETDDDADDEPVDPRGRRPTIYGRQDFEMDAIGWGIFVIILVLIIPLLPALIIAAIIAKLLGLGQPRRLSWSERGPRVQ